MQIFLIKKLLHYFSLFRPLCSSLPGGRSSKVGSRIKDPWGRTAAPMRTIFSLCGGEIKNAITSTLFNLPTKTKEMLQSFGGKTTLASTELCCPYLCMPSEVGPRPQNKESWRDVRSVSTYYIKSSHSATVQRLTVQCESLQILCYYIKFQILLNLKYLHKIDRYSTLHSNLIECQ